MRNFFSLGREIKLEIESAEKSGQIKVNDVSLPEGGMSGTYSAGLDLDLEFQTTPGYKFEGWQLITRNVRDSRILPRNSSWKYHDSGIFPGDSWKTNSYDDSFWQEGLGELGYGDGGESTLLDFGTDTLNKHISYYFRHMIDIQNPENFGELALDMLHDDGAVVYLNGAEVFRYNMPSGDVFPKPWH